MLNSFTDKINDKYWPVPGTLQKLKEEVSQKFNISINDLEYLGKGYAGLVFGIDQKSVLKITNLGLEKNLVLKFIEMGLTLHPGYVSILPDDTLEVDSFFIYRRERLLPVEHIKGMPIYNSIADNINQISVWLNSACRRKMLSPEEKANYFLDIMDELKFLEKELYVTIILFAYEVLQKGIELTDLNPSNAGFRLKETGSPALDAGLVFFDPLAWGVS